MFLEETFRGGRNAVTCWKHSNDLRVVMQKRSKNVPGFHLGCSFFAAEGQRVGLQAFAYPFLIC